MHKSRVHTHACSTTCPRRAVKVPRDAADGVLASPYIAYMYLGLFMVTDMKVGSMRVLFACVP